MHESRIKDVGANAEREGFKVGVRVVLFESRDGEFGD